MLEKINAPDFRYNSVELESATDTKAKKTPRMPSGEVPDRRTMLYVVKSNF